MRREKPIQIVFTIAFLAILVIPALFADYESTVSESENRRLSTAALLKNEDGSWNRHFMSDLEDWFNDRIGFRNWMILNNARIQYHLFHQLPGDIYNNILGPNGEANYLTASVAADYQHLNLLSDDELDQIVESYQTYADFLKERGVQLYYIQCWDRQSIYPEYFPKHILQYGEVSRTDQLVNALREKTDIHVISLKEPLIAQKEQFRSYGTWYDSSHWTPRGAFLGYRLIMEEINRNNAERYRVLQETDYDLTEIDMGAVYFGGIHETDREEQFLIKKPLAYQTEEEPIRLSRYANESRHIFYNDQVDNKDTLLIVGDSYIEGYLYDDFAESFHRVVFVRTTMARYIEELVDYYQPVIVLHENVERQDGSGEMIVAANELRMR